jgi:uncharacterized membrane protein YedE/YeeE
MRLLVALLAGALFGVGLALAHMTDPTVVLGFLDVAGHFDPTLGFVLGGAAGTTLLTFRFVLARRRPLFAQEFELPQRRAIDAPLLLGAAIFGVGWGVAGYCPGPALVALGAGTHSAFVFVPALILGGVLQRLSARRAG